MSSRHDHLSLHSFLDFPTSTVTTAAHQPRKYAKREAVGRSFAFLTLAMTLAALIAPAAYASSNPSFTSLTVSPGNSIVQGTALTLQASVDDGEGSIQRGSVTFYDGTQLLAAIAVVRTGSAYPLGTANLKVYLGPGTHVFKAVYGGISGYTPSTSNTQTVAVSPESAAVTTTTIVASGGAGNYTLTGKVTAYSSVAPTGNVTFTDQTNSNATLGSPPLDPETLTSGWQTMTSYTSAGTNYGIVVGDLNGDGKPDIVVSNYSGTSVSVFLGNGDGTYQTHVDYAVPNGSFGLALGDLNGDGALDLVVANHTSSSDISVFLGNGDGTLQAKQDYANGGTSEYVGVGDFNNDGYLDVVAMDSGNAQINIFRGNGDGTLQAKTPYSVGSYPYGLALADFNGDRNLDAAVVNGNGNTLSVLLGNGDGTLQAQTTYATGTEPYSVVAVDLNGDGKLDLVVANATSLNASAFLNNGDGTFQAKVDYATGSAWGLVAGDVDGDGFMDVVVAGPGNQKVSLLRGNGDGTLKAAVNTSTGASNYWLAVADLNGDGVLDIAVSNLGGANMTVSLGSISETATISEVAVQGGGTHKVLASYSGDENSADSSSATVDLTGSSYTTEVALSAVPNPAIPGQSVTMTATVTPASESGFTAGGTITFFDGESMIGAPVALESGQAAMSQSDFTIGSHVLTAVYSGDTNFNESASGSVNLNVNKRTQTITFAAMNPVTLGVSPITLVASSDSELPVSFSLVSGPATLSGSTLTITGGGSVVVEADQEGDATYQAASPVQRTLMVNKAASTASLVTSNANANLNASVTFTATASSSLATKPSGTFAFLDGETKLATVDLNGQGVAAYTTSSLTAGTHPISAVYNGNANFHTSTSNSLSEVVSAPDYTITATPNTVTIKRGQSGTANLAIAPVGGYTGEMSFTCSELPQYAACSFSPASVQVTGDNQAKTVHLTVTTISQPVVGLTSAPLSTPGPMQALAILSPLGLAGLIVSSTRRKRKLPSRWLARLGIMLLGATLLGIMGCGSSSGPPTSPVGSSNVTVTAGAVGAGASHSTSITITITQ